MTRKDRGRLGLCEKGLGRAVEPRCMLGMPCNRPPLALVPTASSLTSSGTITIHLRGIRDQGRVRWTHRKGAGVLSASRRSQKLRQRRPEDGEGCLAADASVLGLASSRSQGEWQTDCRLRLRLVQSLCSSGKWQGADSQRYSGVRRARTAKCKPEPSGGARAAGCGALGALP